MVEPVDPLERGVFDGFKAAPRSSLVDDLRLVEAVDRLSQSVVETVAADGRFDPGVGEAFGVFDEHVLRPPVCIGVVVP